MEDKRSDIWALVVSCMREGNTVNLVRKIRTTGDADLGIEGLLAETLTLISPEPAFLSVKVQAVKESDGALRYSDVVMSLPRTSLDEAVAYSDPSPEWDVNGDRYITVMVHTTQLTWEFTIRRKLDDES